MIWRRQERSQDKRMSNDDVVVSLFAGAGGFSTGFSQAGLKPIFGAEINQDACQTYQQNVGSPCHQLDLSTVEPTHLENLLAPASHLLLLVARRVKDLALPAHEILQIPATSLFSTTSTSLRGCGLAGLSLRTSRAF